MTRKPLRDQDGKRKESIYYPAGEVHALLGENGAGKSTSIGNIRAVTTNRLIDEKKIQKQAERYKDKLRIKTPSLRQLVKNLNFPERQYSVRHQGNYSAGLHRLRYLSAYRQEQEKSSLNS